MEVGAWSRWNLVKEEGGSFQLTVDKSCEKKAHQAHSGTSHVSLVT
jgi:hypothetical protein